MSSVTQPAWHLTSARPSSPTATLKLAFLSSWAGQRADQPVHSEPRAVTHHTTPASSPTWTPDGKTIYFLADDAPTNEERERIRRRVRQYQAAIRGALSQAARMSSIWPRNAPFAGENEPSNTAEPMVKASAPAAASA